MGLSPALEEAAGVRPADMGAFMLVMNPALASNGGFPADMDHWLSTYLSAAGADARYPGQRAAESEVERRRTGIPVAPELLRRLAELADRIGRPLPVIG
jgi:LDH2 family malate/lactate/ureidoglycolate dehydrogenase